MLERRKLMNKKRLLIAIIFFIGFSMCGYIVFHNKTIQYTFDGAVNDILHSKYSSCFNCENQDFYFIQTNDDPQILFSHVEDSLSGVEISLAQPAPKELSFQLFWSADGTFHDAASYTGYIKTGEYTVQVPIDQGNWQHLRLDMDGTFTLKSFTTLQNLHKSYIIESNKLPEILKQIGVFLLLYALAITLHIRKGRKQSYYIQSMLGRSDKPRNYAYDYLRVLAVLMVICTHAIQSDMSLVPAGSVKAFLMTMVYVLCLGCNLIYVMLSGALLLPYKEEKLSNFYLHRVSRVALPMIIYFVFYLFQNKVISDFNISSLKLVFERLFTGNTPESPHYWLMYVLLSLYVVYPFLRYMFKNLRYQILTQFVIVIIAFMAVSVYFPAFYQPFAVSPFIASWIGIAIIGYWLSQKETRQYDSLLILLGFFSAVITAFFIKGQANFLELTTNTAPTMVLFCSGLYVFVFKYNHILQKPNILVSFLSKYSYSIILVHWWTLYFIIHDRLAIFTYQYKFVGGLLLSLTLNVVISACVAFLIDNILMISVDAGFLFVTRWAEKLLAKLKWR